MENLPRPNGPMSLQVRPANSSLQRALDDHLMLSEATMIAGDLLSQFPSTKADVSDGFIGALASVLMQYPRQVSLKCADPRVGLAREAKFISIADIVGWCEKQTEPMRRDLAREDRIAQQLLERAEWEDYKPSDRLKALGKAWLERSDPDAERMARDSRISEQARRAETLANIDAANQRIFERECARDGIDPSRGVSSALLKVLKDQSKTKHAE